MKYKYKDKGKHKMIVYGTYFIINIEIIGKPVSESNKE